MKKLRSAPVACAPSRHDSSRYTEVGDAEERVRWQADYSRIKAQVEKAAEAFAADYPKHIKKLICLFDTSEIDQAIERLNPTAPQGEHRRLRGVELTARNLESFSTAHPSIVETARLPSFKDGGVNAWPPPQTAFAVFATAAITNTMATAFRPGSREEYEARVAARRAYNERVAAYYEQREREREARERAAQRNGA